MFITKFFILFLFLFLSIQKSSADFTGQQFSDLGEQAESSLNANILELKSGSYLMAGQNQFATLWTRDFGYSVRGLILAGRTDTVRLHIEKLLSLVRDSDGLVPKVMDSVNPSCRVTRCSAGLIFKFIKPYQHPSDPITAYFEDENGSQAIDSNVLVLLAALDYVDATGDTDWLKTNADKLKKVYGFYDQHKDSRGLIYQKDFSDWQDSVRRKGFAFQTNLLYYEATRRLQKYSGFLSQRKYETQSQSQVQVDSQSQDQYQIRSQSQAFPQPKSQIHSLTQSHDETSIISESQLESQSEAHSLTIRPLEKDFEISTAKLSQLRKKLIEVFFDKKKNLFRTLEGEDRWSLESQLLAIESGFVHATEAESLYKSLKNSELWLLSPLGLPGRATYPSYPTSQHSLAVRVAGLTGYHSKVYWSWLMAYAAKISVSMKDKSEAARILGTLSRLYTRDGSVGEVFRDTAEMPLWRSRLYKAEMPFSWGAAYTLDAFSTFQKTKQPGISEKDPTTKLTITESDIQKNESVTDGNRMTRMCNSAF